MIAGWRAAVLSLLVLFRIGLSAQLPPSEKLSVQDNKEFTEELERVRDLLENANDKGSVEFQIARTYAAGGQYREALQWLRKIVESDLGFDPSRDKLFVKLSGAKEYQSLLDTVHAHTPPVSNSRLVATVRDAGLFPENLAYDPATKTFFLGSTLRHEVVRCNRQGACQPFVAPRQHGLGYVLGLKIDPVSKTLWAASNTEGAASLRHYSLASGHLLQSYALRGRHLFNDLVVSSRGQIFVTDTKESAVYRLSNESSKLERVAPDYVFTAANGIALSPDERTLYVASFGHGLSAIDLTSLPSRAHPVHHPARVCLGYIDGLYARKDGLLAIQNGPMIPRIVHFVLSPDGREIVDAKVLERGNPLFDGLTTGTLIGKSFYYVANSQLDKVADGKVKAGVTLDPLRILAIDVRTPSE